MITQEKNTQKALILRQEFDKARLDLIPDLIEDVCPGCHIYGSSKQNGVPCFLYSPEIFYYDLPMKKFWCKCRR